MLCSMEGGAAPTRVSPSRIGYGEPQVRGLPYSTLIGIDRVNTLRPGSLQ
jgi:hypothetical protein